VAWRAPHCKDSKEVRFMGRVVVIPPSPNSRSLHIKILPVPAFFSLPPPSLQHHLSTHSSIRQSVSPSFLKQPLIKQTSRHQCYSLASSLFSHWPSPLPPSLSQPPWKSPTPKRLNPRAPSTISTTALSKPASAKSPQTLLTTWTPTSISSSMAPFWTQR